MTATLARPTRWTAAEITLMREAAEYRQANGITDPRCDAVYAEALTQANAGQLAAERRPATQPARNGGTGNGTGAGRGRYRKDPTDKQIGYATSLANQKLADDPELLTATL